MFYVVCVCLFGLGLFVACGALCACRVRRLYDLMRVCLCFSLYVLVFVLLSLCLLSLACSLVCLVCSCCSCGSLWVSFVSFSLSDYTQKERAQSVCLASYLRVLCVALSCCCFVSPFSLSVYMFSASLSVDSFAFENIHPAPQERWLLNLPPRVLRVSLIAFVSPTIAIAFSE